MPHPTRRRHRNRLARPSPIYPKSSWQVGRTVRLTSALGHPRRFWHWHVRLRVNLGSADCPCLPVEGTGLDVIQASRAEPRIMRYELTDFEWAASRHSFLPNKPGAVAGLCHAGIHPQLAAFRRVYALVLPWRRTADLRRQRQRRRRSWPWLCRGAGRRSDFDRRRQRRGLLLGGARRKRVGRGWPRRSLGLLWRRTAGRQWHRHQRFAGQRRQPSRLPEMANPAHATAHNPAFGFEHTANRDTAANCARRQ